MAVKFGPYELLSTIARGGMAEIFLARPLEGPPGRRVIIKRILPGMAGRRDVVQMFLDEGRVTALFDHPNVVGCSPPEACGGTWFLAMDYVEGTNLARLLQYIYAQGYGLPLPLCAWVVACVASGLDHAHRICDPETGAYLHVVHRDVTPDNILIGTAGEVKIADFGIAKSVGRKSKTMFGMRKGKMGYMSPEQAEGGQVDYRSDVFGLGVVLWELLTRQTLYAGEADFIALQRIAREEPIPPSRMFADVDPDLDVISLRALQKAPQERFVSAGEMAGELFEWLDAHGYEDPAASFADWLTQLGASR